MPTQPGIHHRLLLEGTTIELSAGTRDGATRKEGRRPRTKGRKAGRATPRGREVPPPREMAEKGGLGQGVATRATRQAEAEEEKGQALHDEGEPALDRTTMRKK